MDAWHSVAHHPRARTFHASLRQRSGAKEEARSGSLGRAFLLCLGKLLSHDLGDSAGFMPVMSAASVRGETRRLPADCSESLLALP
jgi:hypothetical protein